MYGSSLLCVGHFCWNGGYFVRISFLALVVLVQMIAILNVYIFFSLLIELYSVCLLFTVECFQCDVTPKVGFPQALQGANEFHINTLPTHMHTITITIKTRSKKRLRSFFRLVIKLYWNIKAIVIIFLWNSIWQNDIWNVETRLLTFSLHQHVIRHFTFRNWFVALDQDKEHLYRTSFVENGLVQRKQVSKNYVFGVD